jgi:crotonobetainyl-CoA:carnitine CoA-transferase CaiB-like acyl-CoA transferase
MPSQIRCADGRHVNTGVPPRSPADFRAVHAWIEELGLLDEYPEAFLLELGGQRERIDLSKIREDEELQAIFGAGREAQNLIASRVSAHDFFLGSQERGLAVGVIYSPEEVMEDPHFAARGFRVEVEHPERGQSFVYPGAPYRFERSPWRISRRAPRLGEHNDAVLGPLSGNRLSGNGPRSEAGAD